FWAVRRLLEHLARERPVIVGVDELQWAEPTFLDLIEYLVGWTSDAPILLVGLARPELLEKRPTWTSTSSLLVRLEPLSPAETEQLVEVLGTGDVSADERRRILEAGEGNPLFVEQMLALAAEEAPDQAIPPSIHALLAARLDRLAGHERAVLERASVIGREFTGAAVAALSDDDSTAATLLALVRRDLIEPDRSLIAGDDGFRFRHVLIRDAAYLAVAKESRARLHLRYAEWLEEAAGELDELVGYHLEQAFRYRQELGAADVAVAARAGERLAAAGCRAVDRGDLPAAVSLLTRAAAILPDSHEERRRILPVLGSALMRSGDFSRAERALTESLEAAHAAGDTQLELRTVIEREFLRTFTDPEESVESIVAVAERAIPLLEELGDDAGLAKAWWLRSELHLNACRWQERAENLERALAHARRAGDAAEHAAIAGQLAVAVYYGPTPVEAAIRRCENLLAEQPEDRSLEAAITSTLAGLTAMRGDFDEARRLQDRAREVYEELGMRFRIGIRSLLAAEIELLAGRPEEAVKILRWAMDSLREMGVTSATSTLAAFLADALASASFRDEAIHYADVARETSADVDVVNQVLWRVAKAKASGDATLAAEALELAAPTDYPDLKARALIATGATAEAVRVYERKGNVAAVERLSAVAPSS
ncbi:MAG: adenylate/guanylate cyclase domain-containing protein, partial [Actinomycetota bacterium]|nr:adenylate/guanylate cyclase domain-containing protein [Actinomycetota bacterium]